MRGFTPGKMKANCYADGGIIENVKGMLGFKPQDPERARLLAEYKANAAREKQAAKQPAATPVQPKALTGYAAGSALKSRMDEVDKYKDGGMIRGPGTGTSDSIPRGFKPGTFIMPADSTKAIGPEVLENIAKVPTKVSNGEFAYTPKEVHAVGIEALNGMKDATHKPSDKEINPAMYLADGGMVRGFQPQRLAVGGGVMSEDERREALAGIPTTGYPKAPTADGSQDSALNTNLGRNVTNTLAALPGSTGLSTLASRALSASVPAASKLAQAAGAVAPYGVPAAGLAGLQNAAAPASAPAPKPAPALMPGARTDVQRGGASPGAMPERTNTGFVPESLSAPKAPSNITRTGNSYTGPANIAGDISVNGQAPRGSATTLPAGATPFAGSPAVSAQGFSPSMQGISAQNMGAADNLAARGQMESMGRLMASGQIQAPGAGPSFIMQSNTGFRRDPRLVAPEDAARRTLRYAQGDDPASRERKAKFQTAQLEQQGLAQRNQATNDIAQKELALKIEAQGFTTRAAQQMENMRNVLLDPKATPEHRSQALLVLSGKERGPRWKTSVVPGGVDAMGNKLPGYGLLTDEASGESKIIQPGQGAAPAIPQGAVELLKKDPKNAAEFDRKYGAGAAARAMSEK